jgi:hypothetical protein
MTGKMHNFEQVKDVLAYGIDLHKRLRSVYDDLGDQSDQTRVKMVLDYLSRHERNRQHAMQRFEEGTRKKILNVWMQYAPSSDIEQILLDESTRSDLTVDDVITMAMRFDDAMIAIYRETASEIADVHAREVFQNLAEMEHREKQRFVRDAEWVQDL